MEEKEIKEAPAEQAEKETAQTEKASKKKKEAQLQKTIDELNDKLSCEHDSYLRLYAEFETFRRRTSEEKLALVNSAAADTIKGLLPVLDDCEQALKMLETSSDAAAKEGTALIYNKLMDYLKTRGLSVIEAKGKKFDTDFHEALTQIPAPTEDQKGMVLDVFQTGYMLNGKILRYAKVIVGA